MTKLMAERLCKQHLPEYKVFHAQNGAKGIAPAVPGYPHGAIPAGYGWDKVCELIVRVARRKAQEVKA